MPELDADLAELQRRAYGPDGDDLSPVERARLAQFEASFRIPDTQSGTPAPLPPVPSISGSEHTEHDDSSSGHAAEYPGESAQAHTSGRSMSGSPQSVGAGDASDRVGIRHGVKERDQNSGGAAGHGSKWFTPALIATIGVGAVIVMVLAGVIGWGGGYVAGFARHTGPGGSADFVTELHPTEMPDRYADAASDFAGSPDSAGILDGRTYFGSLGEGIDIFTIRPSDIEDDDQDLPSDAVCLNVAQTVELSANKVTFAGDSACGLSQLDVTVDLFVGAAGEEYQSGSRLRTDAYPENTLLRFTYTAVTDVVTVWRLSPSK